MAKIQTPLFRAAWIAIALSLLGASIGAAQSIGIKKKEVIAVVDLEIVGWNPIVSAAVSDRLREELLRTGYFTLVDRSVLDNVLVEQRIEWQKCNTPECAVRVGNILGARVIVAGKVSKLDTTLWNISAQMIDVKTAETLRAESVLVEGSVVALIEKGIPKLAGKLVPDPPPGRQYDSIFALVDQLVDDIQAKVYEVIENIMGPDTDE